MIPFLVNSGKYIEYEREMVFVLVNKFNQSFIHGF
jgi:hypothetical protein